MYILQTLTFYWDTQILIFDDSESLVFIKTYNQLTNYSHYEAPITTLETKCPSVMQRKMEIFDAVTIVIEIYSVTKFMLHTETVTDRCYANNENNLSPVFLSFL